MSNVVESIDFVRALINFLSLHDIGQPMNVIIFLFVISLLLVIGYDFLNDVKTIDGVLSVSFLLNAQGFEEILQRKAIVLAL